MSPYIVVVMQRLYYRVDAAHDAHAIEQGYEAAITQQAIYFRDTVSVTIDIDLVETAKVQTTQGE